MNYKNRVAKITAYLASSLIRYDELRASLPELKRKVAKQEKVVDKLETELGLFWQTYPGNPSYSILTDVLEDIDERECEILSNLEDDVSEAISELEDIENGIDDAYYGAGSAAGD
jgi:hypothetical protein